MLRSLDIATTLSNNTVTDSPDLHAYNGSQTRNPGTAYPTKKAVSTKNTVRNNPYHDQPCRCIDSSQSRQYNIPTNCGKHRKRTDLWLFSWVNTQSMLDI